ncbi:MAG: hypothetical protein JWN78_1149 [Bacteroidota bacterium]|nr:hypothetical protein [Bacteroidota bacterium]
MEKKYTSFLRLSILIGSIYFLPHNLNGQTYASPELKAKVEKEDAAKAAKTGIVKSKSAPEAREDEMKRAPFDFNLLQGIYRLQKVEAIDHSGKHTAEEMKRFTKEAEGEFAARDWAVNMDRSIIYFVRRNDNTNYRYINFYRQGKYMLETGCTNCEETKFEIIENTNQALVLELKPQDEGQYFMYRFTFKK